MHYNVDHIPVGSIACRLKILLNVRKNNRKYAGTTTTSHPSFNTGARKQHSLILTKCEWCMEETQWVHHQYHSTKLCARSRFVSHWSVECVKHRLWLSVLD